MSSPHPLSLSHSTFAQMTTSDSGSDGCNEHADDSDHAQPLSLTASATVPPAITLPVVHPAHSPSQPVSIRSKHSPLLLDGIPRLRSLVWQYMDNRSAIQYLSACRRLRRLYHSFPLTEPVSRAQFAAVDGVGGLWRGWWRRFTGDTVRPWASCYTTRQNISTLVTLVVTLRMDWSKHCTLLATVAALQTVAVLAFLIPSLFPCRTHCCKGGRRLNRFRPQRPIPRIIRMADWCALDDLPYLQHAEEVHVVENTDSVRIDGCQLPHTLRRLALSLNDYSRLQVGALPPQLTALALDNLDDRVVMQSGLLPQSLAVLVLYYPRSVSRSMQPITPGVLPSQLQRLVIQWTRSLADLALPASLTQLVLLSPPDDPIPPDSLPAGLHTLRILAGSFHPLHLHRALPPDLHVLRLHCQLTEPLTAGLLAKVPQLEELDLGGYYQHPLLTDTLA